MHARLGSDLDQSVFMILQTHTEVNIRHQSTARCWKYWYNNCRTAVLKTAFFGDLVQEYQREKANISAADVSKSRHLTTKQSVSLSLYIIIQDIYHKKHGCPHLCNNKHSWSVLKRYQYCSFLKIIFAWTTLMHLEESGRTQAGALSGAGQRQAVLLKYLKKTWLSSLESFQIQSHLINLARVPWYL